MQRVSSYKFNVFLNCPFDKEYKPIFDAIIFAVFDCGFVPRCALEISDSGIVRIEKIISIIEQCGYGIHDISRVELDSSTGLPRFNMSFELGLFFGAKWSGSKKQRDKKCLILDAEPYRYKKFVSDISGQDIACHYNDPMKAIGCVRNWFKDSSGMTNVPGTNLIKNRYRKFLSDFPHICNILQISPDDITFNDYSQTVSEWLRLYG